MWFPFTESESPPESLLPKISGACLAVRNRLGPGRPRPVVLSELLRELGGRGFAHVKTRSFRRGQLLATGLTFQQECFDLVIESRSVIEFAASAVGEKAARQLSAFEDRLTRYGWAEGLLVDFDQTDPIDGLWIVRNPDDFLSPERAERMGSN